MQLQVLFCRFQGGRVCSMRWQFMARIVCFSLFYTCFGILFHRDSSFRFYRLNSWHRESGWIRPISRHTEGKYQSIIPNADNTIRCTRNDLAFFLLLPLYFLHILTISMWFSLSNTIFLTFFFLSFFLQFDYFVVNQMHHWLEEKNSSVKHNITAGISMRMLIDFIKYHAAYRTFSV